MRVRALSRNVSILLASRTIRTFPFGYLSVLLPIYLASTNTSLTVGLFYFVSAISCVIMALILGVYGDRVGIGNMLVIQLLLSGVSFLLIGCLPMVPLLLLMAALLSNNSWGPGGGSGAGGGPFPITINLLLNDFSDANSRTFVFSLASLSGTIVFSASAFLLGFVNLTPTVTGEAYSFAGSALVEDLFVFAFLTQVVAIVLLFVIPRFTERGRRVEDVSGLAGNKMEKSINGILKETRLFLGAEFSNSFGNGLYATLVSLWFFVRFHTSIATIATIIAVIGLTTAVGFFFSARIEAALGAVNSIFAGRGFLALVLVAIIFAPAAWVAFILYGVAALLLRLTTPIQQSFFFSMIRKEHLTSAASMISISNLLGFSFGPLLGAYLVLDASPDLIFIFAIPFIAFSAAIYKAAFRGQPSKRNDKKERWST